MHVFSACLHVAERLLCGVNSNDLPMFAGRHHVRQISKLGIVFLAGGVLVQGLDEVRRLDLSEVRIVHRKHAGRDRGAHRGLESRAEFDA